MMRCFRTRLYTKRQFPEDGVKRVGSMTLFFFKSLNLIGGALLDLPSLCHSGIIWFLFNI